MESLKCRTYPWCLQPPPSWMNTAANNFTTSELTPSESNITSDDEEIKVHVSRSESEMVLSTIK